MYSVDASPFAGMNMNARLEVYGHVCGSQKFTSGVIKGFIPLGILWEGLSHEPRSGQYSQSSKPAYSRDPVFAS